MQTKTKVYDLIVAGGGVAGVAAAITAAREGLKVLILEQSNRLLKKLAASGNGMCNIANDLTLEGKYNSDYVQTTFQKIDLNEILNYYKSLGLLLKLDNNRWYPYSKHSGTVLNSMLKELKRLNVLVLTNTEVKSIISKQSLFTVNDTFKSKYLLLTLGSSAHTGFDGLNLAKELGHNTLDFKPSMVHMLTDTKHIKGMNGVRVYYCNVSLKVDSKIIATTVGDVIFRDYGVSGSAIFDISIHLARLKSYEKASLILDFLPEKSLPLEKFDNKNDSIDGFFHKEITRIIKNRAKSHSLEDLIYISKNFELKNAALGPDRKSVV